MSKKPLLTAILFTYNHSLWIEKCIKSLLEQKTTYPYEIHIWDDCSTDGTSDICRKYAKKYPDKIKLTVQKENTFLKPYLELQSYMAICSIKTKYFCIIDGDDYWCSKNKVQKGIDFLESHPDYVGWGHDTCIEDICEGTQTSYIHDGLGLKEVKNPLVLSTEAPFLLTSSRIFRKFDYEKLGILPIDYLLYYYHLSKGKVYYHDEIMAKYLLGDNNTFATKVNVCDMNGMFSYKLSKMFNFTQDDFCTAMQKKYDLVNGVREKRYKKLCKMKKIFGLKLGWKLWFLLTFVKKYGFICMNTNYVCDHKKAKLSIDNISKNFNLLQQKIKYKQKYLNKYQWMLSTRFINLCPALKKTLASSIVRKQQRIARLQKKMDKLTYSKGKK